MSGNWGHSFVILQSTGPIETDLVTLDDLKLELGITSTTEDAALQARITRLSEQIAEYCDRILALIDVEETFAFNGGGRPWPTAPGDTPGSGIPLVLMQYPVTEIVSLTRDGAAIDPAEYDLNALSGLLWPRSGSWGGRIVAQYSGGYDLPEGAPATLQSAVIEAVRQRRAYSSRDPSIREVSHDITRVGYYSEPLNSTSGLSQSVAGSLDLFRRQYV
jgi:Phage gp6-like head-tail connector protein